MSLSASCSDLPQEGQIEAFDCSIQLSQVDMLDVVCCPKPVYIAWSFAITPVARELKSTSYVDFRSIHTPVTPDRIFLPHSFYGFLHHLLKSDVINLVILFLCDCICSLLEEPDCYMQPFTNGKMFHLPSEKTFCQVMISGTYGLTLPHVHHRVLHSLQTSIPSRQAPFFKCSGTLHISLYSADFALTCSANMILSLTYTSSMYANIILSADSSSDCMASIMNFMTRNATLRPNLNRVK